MKSTKRCFSFALALTALLAASGPASGQEWLKEITGADAGKRRVQRESLVRAPDGTWSVETAAGLVPHPVQAEYAAAEEMYKAQKYTQAAAAFKRIGYKYKGSAVQEDCLFEEAESYYADGRLPIAVDTYHALLKDFPTTRHLSQAVQRTYDVVNEWLEDSRLHAQGKPGKYNWFNRNVNFADRRRPFLDMSGRAIEAVEHIQQYDPNGPLTSSATMLAGAQKFTSADYIRAASYYEQVVTEAPKSEYAAKAAVLAAQSYLRSYQGPGYDGTDLSKAQEMTEKAIQRAKDLPPDQVERLKKDLRMILLMRAERDFHSGEEYRQLHRWTSAKVYYDKVGRTYPDTVWAKRAEEEIQKMQPQLAADKAKKERAADAKPASSFSFSPMRLFSKAAPDEAAATGPDKLSPNTKGVAEKLPSPGDSPTSR